jgi:hypothetical protein
LDRKEQEQNICGDIDRNHSKTFKGNLQKSRSIKETDFYEVRESAMGHFSLFYKITPNQIIIMAFWDNRQDPKKLLKAIS